MLRQRSAGHSSSISALKDARHRARGPMAALTPSDCDDVNVGRKGCLQALTVLSAVGSIRPYILTRGEGIAAVVIDLLEGRVLHP